MVRMPTSKLAKNSKRILIIDGHPDGRPERLCHQLAMEYRAGAVAAGHEVRVTRLADLDFPWLRTNDSFNKDAPPAAIKREQACLLWAEHVVVIFPLWLGTMPALLKAYLEQVLRPGFAFGPPRKVGPPKRLLAGRSARVIVTMGGPAMFYRLVYGAHGLKGLERSILGFVGLRPIRDTAIGEVENMTRQQWQAWADEMRELGRRAK
jgi:putative NADPH-quinone reductase